MRHYLIREGSTESVNTGNLEYGRKAGVEVTVPCPSYDIHHRDGKKI